MARTKTRTFPERMRKARADAHMTLDDVAFHLRQLAPQSWRASRATVNRLEGAGMKEEDADPIVVALLAQIYHCEVQVLSPWIASELASVMAILTHDNGAYLTGSGVEQLALPLPGWGSGGETWTIQTSSTGTGKRNGHEDSRPRRNAATARPSGISPDSWQTAA